MLLDLFRLTAWFVVLAAVFIPLERVFTLHAQRIFRRGFIADVVYFFLNGLIPKLVLVAPLTILAIKAHRILPSGYYSTIASLPIIVRLLAAIVTGEFGSYWAHRWMHEWPFLWRFHAIHHAAEEMDWLVNTHAHPVDLTLTRLASLLPVYLLGLAQPSGTKVDLMPLLYVVLATTWSFAIHANVRWRLGWLEYVLATPAFHHWHHTKDDNAYLNKNYATTLPALDYLFGTHYLPSRWPSQYGIDDPLPEDLAGQIVSPFRITK